MATYKPLLFSLRRTTTQSRHTKTVFRWLLYPQLKLPKSRRGGMSESTVAAHAPLLLLEQTKYGDERYVTSLCLTPLVLVIANLQVPFPEINFSAVEGVVLPILADLPLLHIAHPLGRWTEEAALAGMCVGKVPCCCSRLVVCCSGGSPTGILVLLTETRHLPSVHQRVAPVLLSPSSLLAVNHRFISVWYPPLPSPSNPSDLVWFLLLYFRVPRAGG